MNKTDAILHAVRLELLRAQTKFPRVQSSPHEGYGVLAEEVHEFFLEVIANNHAKAREELIQVAAMALRTILEVYGPMGLPDAAQGVSPGRLTKDTKQEPRKDGPDYQRTDMWDR